MKIPPVIMTHTVIMMTGDFSIPTPEAGDTDQEPVFWLKLAHQSLMFGKEIFLSEH